MESASTDKIPRYQQHYCPGYKNTNNINPIRVFLNHSYNYRTHLSGQGSETARSIQVYENGVLNSKASKQLISAVASNNRAGVRRAFKK
jgi:hypothetical protein